jgi:hypothetical protein
MSTPTGSQVVSGNEHRSQICSKQASFERLERFELFERLERFS